MTLYGWQRCLRAGAVETLIMTAGKTSMTSATPRYAPSDGSCSANREALPVTTPDQPGWYDDPHDPNAQRYWSGQDWTPHRQRKPIARSTPPPTPTQPPPPPPAQPLPPPPGQQPYGPSLGGYPPPPPDANQSGAGHPPLPSGGPPRRSQTPIAVTAVIGVIGVLAVGGFLVYKFVLTGRSEEDQIRALVQNVTAHQNSADGPGLLPLLCERARGQNPGTSEMLRDAINDEGTITASVSDIHVTGDRATAVVISTRSKSPSETARVTDSFVKEDGSWRFCGTSDNSG